ncbi:AraC-like DNA-binding protein [Mucilaginibacter yixingensis]|uniref:AraC-like DNA-binding protein n=1 Tax=Mucilaginibacter yixingensis TaxID=1295612 RepID=A0A2T5J845_9SPHI|nr:helix-turn-helix domain-containing protein [Mucilaginibacter yixingensis]PTQ95643.1 AraC-like DNA-binding protein [Mucilaginibacter yixingensis]
MKPDQEIISHSLGHNFVATQGHLLKFDEFVPSHRLDFYAIVWFLEDNELQHYIDFVSYPIHKNSIYLIARNQVHTLPNHFIKSNVIVFDRWFFDSIEESEYRLMFVPFNNNALYIPEGCLTELNYLFELMEREYHANNDLKLLHWYTEAFLTHLFRISTDGDGGRSFYNERLQLLFRLVSDHFRDQKTNEFYADKIGVSSKRLNQIVKAQMGITVSQLIYNYTLIEAKRELSHSKKPIKQIAYELGFKGPSYFSRFFRKQAGITPETFRQQSA